LRTPAIDDHLNKLIIALNETVQLRIKLGAAFATLIFLDLGQINK
jgi:hypothetical protein